ncbi:CRISPR-associated endonuclease Cas2 [Thiomicrospira microaerophila]|uniref:CRISPR-associated endonuclease Cas2 n=1 Tax=Thiomicrospira microaerophila TaxID=406020 RepID=UPI0006962468|nr:CRISPR-associated endonuclease Cas2 [Thiomicrospira microaerophila]
MAKKVWHLLCYDIANPRRLSRVHRLMKKRGLVAQKSVFFVHASEQGMQQLLADIKGLVNQREDDIRSYPVAHPSKVWMAGLQTQTQLLVEPDSTSANKNQKGDVNQSHWIYTLWPFKSKTVRDQS